MDLDWQKTEMHILEWTNIDKLKYLLELKANCMRPEFGFGLLSSDNEFLKRYNIEIEMLTNLVDLEFKSLQINQSNKDLSQVKGEKEEGNEIIKTRDVINKHIKTLDNNAGWGYAFKNENDYTVFLNLLTYYFTNESYKLPEIPIKLKRDCKTRLAKVLSPIHKELSEKPLKSDKEFFKILKVLNHFKNLSNVQLYDAITR